MVALLGDHIDPFLAGLIKIQENEFTPHFEQKFATGVQLRLGYPKRLSPLQFLEGVHLSNKINYDFTKFGLNILHL
jgi:hypothetical protein